MSHERSLGWRGRTGAMARAVAVAMVALAAGSCTTALDVVPRGTFRATSEIHGVPVCTGAHVENNFTIDYPFGGVPVMLEEDSEAENPPPINIVTLVGTVTPLSACGQRVTLSFYGPNAMDDDPSDDRPIFVDLYGVYTDPDAPGGPCTGPVDLCEVGAWLRWPGLDVRDMRVEASTAGAVIVDTDGTTREIAVGEHPMTMSVVEFGEDDYRLRFSLYSSVLENARPWVPALLDEADEVHLSFEVFVEPPCPEDLDGEGAVEMGDILLLLSWWGPCE